jgi:hypothetical protein
MIGVPPRVIRSDDAVTNIRDEREQQQKAAQQAQIAEQMAKAGKSMASSPMDQDSVLTRLNEQIESQKVA